MTNLLSQPVTLPCGAVLPNRIAKAAMSEGMADVDNHSTPRLERLYRRSAESGAGLLLSGNIQVDRWHLERPGNVVADDDSGLDALAALAATGKAKGAAFWAQLSHTGRQVADAINASPLAPSQVAIDIPQGAGYSFAAPRAMTEAEIALAIAQFARSAGIAKKAGFTGVQLHGAHGYLISQFLSPLTNRRADTWGGPLENRARFLLAAIKAVRDAVGREFPVGLKLNSSDFQRGGFRFEDCLEVVKILNGSTLDLLELSGGSLEQPKVVGIALKDEGEDGRRTSTAKREAYFLALAGGVRDIAKMPVMVTGGFRTATAITEALAGGELDVVGIGRPLIADPLTPAKLVSGMIERAPAPEADIFILHLLPWFNMQLARLADGLDPDLALSGETAAAQFAPLEKRATDDLLARRATRAA